MDVRAIEPPPKTRSVHLEDIGAQLEVRRHPGARRLTLRVSRTRRAVIVTLPLQCDLDEAGTFLNRHIDWVRARLDSLPNQVPFEDGAAMPLRGEPHMIAFTGCTRTRLISIDRPKGKRPHILVPGAKEFAANRIVRWLFDEARRDLEVSVTRHARLLSLQGKKYRRARSDEPLGILLDDRGSVILVALGPGAAIRSRLRRRPRSCPSCRDESRSALLGAREKDPPRL